jgi:ABC-type transport system substrate-binding protein
MGNVIRIIFTASGILKSAAVRIVLSRCIDRENLGLPKAESAALPLNPAWWPLTGAKPSYAAPGSSAHRGLLSAAGLSDSDGDGLLDTQGTARFDAQLTLIVSGDSPSMVRISERVSKQLAAAGFDVLVSRLDKEKYDRALTRGEFDLYLAEIVLTSDMDLGALLGSAGAGGSKNFGRYAGAEMDAALSAMRAAASDQELQSRVAAFAALFESQTPVVPLCFRKGTLLIGGVDPSTVEVANNHVFYNIENWKFD